MGQFKRIPHDYLVVYILFFVSTLRRRRNGKLFQYSSQWVGFFIIKTIFFKGKKSELLDRIVYHLWGRHDIM